MKSNLLNQLSHEVRLFLEPITRAGTNPEQLRYAILKLGWDIDLLLGSDLQPLTSSLGALETAINTIKDTAQQPPQTLNEAKELLSQFSDIFELFENISISLNPTLPPEASELIPDVLNRLLVIYLRRRSPFLFHFLYLFNIISDDEVVPIVINGDQGLKLPVDLPIIHLDRLSALVTEPGVVLKDTFLTDTLATIQTSNEVAKKLFPPVGRVLSTLGIEYYNGLDPKDETAYDPDIIERMHGLISLSYQLGLISEVGATIGFLPDDEGGPGVFIVPFGELTTQTTLGDWLLTSNLDIGLEGFQITGQGIQSIGPEVLNNISLDFELAKLKEEGVAYQIGSATGSRLEINDLNLAGSLTGGASHAEYKILLRLGNSRFIIAGGEGDNFLNNIIPEEGIEVEFDLAVGWSNLTGFYFEGSGGLKIDIPVNKPILGFLDVKSIPLGINIDGDGFNTFLTLNGDAKLGPFTVALEEVGIQALITAPQSGGNLGPLNLDFGFKTPSGLGITIDTNTVKGGGYLYFDKPNERYSGAIELKVGNGSKAIQLKAIGILTTKVPGDPDGYSFLIMVTAEFSPIPLGFGFNLKGVGGLAGLHRTMSVPVLRDGVKNDTLDNILFPEDVIKNINQIITDLETTFPIEQGRYAFGLMGQLTWGSPKLIDIELGLMLEVPEPVKLAILGVVKIVLPSEDVDLVRIQINFLGVIDFEKKHISFDASIYDSKLLSFRLAGDMAFRLMYGNRPNFLLTVGGFHPDFNPPPLNLPEIQRLTINFVNKRKLKITLQFYMAITSNSIQGGARLDLLAGPILGFAAVGLLAFDALFQFSPFYFNVHIQAGIAIVKVRTNKKVLGIYLSLQVEGPKPWRIKGVVEVTIIVKVKINVNVTIGQPDHKDKLPDVNVLPLLKEAISNTDNWEAIAPNSSNLLVTVREIENANGKLVIHPSGKLSVKQKVMPLRTSIKKFGKQNPKDHNWLDIEVRNSAGETWTKEKELKEWFAPADFQELSNSAKIKAPSFQEMPAGQAIAAGDRSVDAGQFRQIRCEYEQIVMERRYDAPTIGAFRPSAHVFQGQLRSGSAARSKLGRLHKKGASPFVAGSAREGAVRSTLAPKRVQVGKASGGGFAIVGARDLQLFENTTKASQAEAKLALETILQERPELIGQLKVMPDFARPLVQ